MLDLNALLKYAGENGASDIHITVGVSPLIRVSGKLRPTPFQRMTTADTLEVFLGIVSPIQRDKFENAGEIDLSVSIPGAGRYRVNAYKQRGSITLALRLVEMEIPDPQMLMIPDVVLDLCNKHRGLIIISGPSGSGKSTLMASMIDRINEVRQACIVTLEDPIEYLHSHKNSIVSQREIGLDTASYLTGLGAALREDADVISLSTLPDEEVATRTFRAAQTGRLIFSAMYTTGIVETIDSIIALFPEYQQEMARNQLASCLRAVVTRQLCDGVGEGERIPAYGIMLNNKKIASYIRSGQTLKIMDVVRESSDQGMISMDDSLFDLCRRGLISSATTLALSIDQESMEERLGESRNEALNQ